MEISAISSRQILDSRGRPTVETTVHLDTGVDGTAAVPSGASTGSHEAVELRDHQPEKFGGFSVEQAVKNVTGSIAQALKGHDIRQQQEIDQLMLDLDGTMNKSKLGANAILSVSLAVARANAALQRTPARLDVETRQLDGIAERVRLLDPATTMARGWSITRTPDGRTVRSADELQPGAQIITTFATGTATSRVEETTP